MPTADEDIARVQMTGILCKRPVNLMNHTSGIIASRWYKRFFVVKDGFLMYYPESEKKEFERKRCANYHPKGVMPLGDCLITRLQEPDSPHMISIVNELSQERLLIQCETAWEQEKWMECLEKSARICFKNSVLGDTLIQQLQVQGARLAEEKQEVYGRLHEEAIAHSEERSRAEEMEQLMQSLEEEKQRIEETSEQLQNELATVSRELQVTSSALRDVELEKEHLAQQQKQLSSVLSTLEEQKLETEQKLLETQTRSCQLEEDNSLLSSHGEQERLKLAEQIRAEQEVKASLEANLQQIKSKMTQVMSEKEEAEHKAEEQVQIAKLLEDEKLLFHQEAVDLERNLTEVKHQKKMTEEELKEEIKARIAAEERLKAAEHALQSLEEKINESQMVASADHRNQLMQNVKALKRYFEEKAIEAKVDADKPIIMKRAVYNKRRNMRAKSMRLIREDMDSVEVPVANGDIEVTDQSTVRLRNSASNVLKNPSLRTMIAQSAHGNLAF